VRRYLHFFRVEYGATPSSIRDYETILAKLALFLPHLAVEQRDVPQGTDLLKDFMAHHWADAAPRTKKKVRSVARLVRRLADAGADPDDEPGAAYPGARAARHRARGVLTACPRHANFVADTPARPHRDFASLALALRKPELSAARFKHFDCGRRRLRIFGKGGTVHDMPEVDRSRLEPRLVEPDW
jgi:hypothetical protein